MRDAPRIQKNLVHVNKEGGKQVPPVVVGWDVAETITVEQGERDPIYINADEFQTWAPAEALEKILEMLRRPPPSGGFRNAGELP